VLGGEERGDPREESESVLAGRMYTDLTSFFPQRLVARAVDIREAMVFLERSVFCRVAFLGARDPNLHDVDVVSGELLHVGEFATW
jgi:hypothetical protein